MQRTNWRKVQLVAVARAVSWLGSDLTLYALLLRESANGGLAVGAIFVAGTLATVVLAPWAGAIADRYPTRVLIPVTTLAQAALVPLFIIRMPLVAVLAIMFVLRTFATVAQPTWLALTPSIAAPADLPRAAGIEQTYQSIARMLGPVAAGVLVAATGYVLPFVIDAFTFLLLAATPRLVDVNRTVASVGTPVRANMLAGFTILWRSRLLRALTFVLTIFILGAGAINVGAIFLITKTLHESSATYGLVEAGFATGTLLGGLAASAIRVPEQRQAAVIITGLTIMGFAELGVAVAANWQIALVTMALAGLGQTVMNAYASSVLIRHTPEEALGRMSAAINGVTQAGLMVSMLAAGVALDAFGVREVLAAGALLSLIALGAAAGPLLTTAR